MPKVVGYHRPATVEEAVGLLALPNTAVLAGGTRVNATPFGNPVVAVDLQQLGLSGIGQTEPGALRIGAATTLQALANSALVPEVLRTLARREAPSTLRTIATVGGTIAAGGWESELLTGLLACDATVELRNQSGTRSVPLADLLADCDLLLATLITSVSLHVDGTFAAEHTGRTPGDTGIVSAVARRSPAGSLTVAASGVAATPVIVTDPSTLTPPSDFRGSTEYRRHVAGVLIARVTKAVSA
jgi:CO/xanthine dehydrogenase FAD-binding subunit